MTTSDGDRARGVSRNGAGGRLLASHALAATAMSMPWPALLAEVWSTTGSDTWLGVAGAARLLPYVVLSAAAGVLADRFPRIAVVRVSTQLRAGLLLGCGVALLVDHLGLAVVLAVLTVAAGTPAYPAAVATMPTLAEKRQADRLTDLLVTAEVTAFVVGPAIGGLLLGAGVGPWSVLAGGAVTLLAWPALAGLSSERPDHEGADQARGRLRTVLSAPGVPVAIAVVAVVDFAEAAASVGLLRLSHDRWGTGDRTFGIATAVLGFASLAAPLLGLLIRRRVSLLVTGAGLAGAGLAPGFVVAAGPLALVGAAGTVVECASTDVLQRAVPDHVRAFALGLTDMVIVLAALLGALVAPGLVSLVGSLGVFVGLGALVAAAALLRSRRRARVDVPALV